MASIIWLISAILLMIFITLPQVLQHYVFLIYIGIVIRLLTYLQDEWFFSDPYISLDGRCITKYWICTRYWFEQPPLIICNELLLKKTKFHSNQFYIIYMRNKWLAWGQKKKSMLKVRTTGKQVQTYRSSNMSILFNENG